MMLRHDTEKFVYLLPALIFLIGFQSQGISSQGINGMAPSRTSCDSNHYCTPAENCRYYRNRPNSFAAAQSCSSQNVHRVCCPRKGHIPKPEVTTPGATIQECGHPILRGINPYIIGGENATEGQWPWMVAITRRNESGYYEPMCGGFLIDRKHVLSAAHCFHGEWIQNRLYSTLIGSVELKKSKAYSIDSIVVHEGYMPKKYYNDIAVLTLSREVHLPNVNPICLPDQIIAKKRLADLGTTVAGWGIEKLDSENMSDNLKQLSEIIVVPVPECNRSLRRIRNFTLIFPNGVNSDFICAGFPGGRRDSCKGDSGGPLMFQDRNKWFAVGLVSFGASCGYPGLPAGYTRISSYLTWIRQNTKN